MANWREAGGDADIAMRDPRGAIRSLGNWRLVGSQDPDRHRARRLPGRGEPARRALERGSVPLIGMCPARSSFAARVELRRATGRLGEARDYLAAAERVAWLPLANPEVFPWRSGWLVKRRWATMAKRGGSRPKRWGCARGRRYARDRNSPARAGHSRGLGGGDRAPARGLGGPGGTRARLEHAKALVELGAALRRANRRKEAREPLREGDRIWPTAAAPCRSKSGPAPSWRRPEPPRKAVYSGVESLTPSELRVARMAAEGKTNREIAQALTVTEKTIETHMRHVFQKLDVGRRTELAGALTSEAESGRPVSNRRPRAWEARALPTELRPRGADSRAAAELPGASAI